MKTLDQRRLAALLLVASSALALDACGTSETTATADPPAAVGVFRVMARSIEVTDELPGRVVAFRIAEIRPQVGGIVQRRLFEQGSEVREGQPLFQINPAPFRADADSARANVARAEATLARSKVQEDRLAPLVKADAISEQSYDDAIASRRSAAAALDQARADLRRRAVDLDFSTIRSPISGRIDQSVLSEGGLAAIGDPNPLATVQQVDRVYVDVRQPVTRLEALRAAALAGSTGDGGSVEILSSDGNPYPVRGKLLFSGISVDPGTGQVIARVEVANANRALLPGMFVRARLPRMHVAKALAVPQQAISHDAGGGAFVTIVDGAGRVSQRKVVTGSEQDGTVVVTQGLKAGELVIVEGQDRASPGAVVRPSPWRAPTTQR